jgi:hypothetical protein
MSECLKMEGLKDWSLIFILKTRLQLGVKYSSLYVLLSYALSALTALHTS